MLEHVEAIWTSKVLNVSQKKASVNTVYAQLGTMARVARQAGSQASAEASTHGQVGPISVLQAANHSAARIHNVLVCGFPCLHGKATRSLGTALRSAIVRDALSHGRVRGESLLTMPE